MSTSTGARRKKRSDPFTQVAEEMIALAIVSRVAEELVDGVHCISDGNLELWLVGGGPTGSVEPDDAEILTIANDRQFGMKPCKDGASSKFPLKKVVTDMSSFKTGGVNRRKLCSSPSQSCNGSSQSSLGGGKKQQTSSCSTKSREVRHNVQSKRFS